ncbi:hypothetical protein PIB30_015634 [Stylosanthes scabra]|uniref:Uncharacterized protein n=1 Tax=Stylosanthes scabra TaxID=79078 RepID=A0ABU6S7G5_9FABA|nr:hypothetical protein [Stylosanthes scabra]
MAPEGESTNEPSQNFVTMVEVSSLDRGKDKMPTQGTFQKRPMDPVSTTSKRQRSEGAIRDYSPMDSSFDASGFIASNLLVPRAQEVLKDYDLVESLRWSQWALLKSATIMKSRGKAEEDLKALEVELSNLWKKKDDEIARMKEREEELEGEVKKFRDLATEEKVGADLAQSSVSDLKAQCDSLAEDAKGVVAATETTLKAQLEVLLPDFDSSQIGFFKDIVDGKIRRAFDWSGSDFTWKMGSLVPVLTSEIPLTVLAIFD